MTEIYHDRSMASLLEFYLEAPEGSALRQEIWQDLLDIDGKKCKEQLMILRDELNTLNATNTKIIQTQATE